MRSGVKSPDLQAARGNLANTKHALGDLKGALALSRRDAEAQAQAEPEAHPATATNLMWSPTRSDGPASGRAWSRGAPTSCDMRPCPASGPGSASRRRSPSVATTPRRWRKEAISSGLRHRFLFLLSWVTSSSISLPMRACHRSRSGPRRCLSPQQTRASSPWERRGFGIGFKHGRNRNSPVWTLSDRGRDR